MISEGDITINVTGESGNGINITSYVGEMDDLLPNDDNDRVPIHLQASGDININSSGNGIYVAGYADAKVAIDAGKTKDANYYNEAIDVVLEAGTNISIKTSGNAVEHHGAGTISLLASGDNNITASGDGLLLSNSDDDSSDNPGASGTIKAQAETNYIFASSAALSNSSSNEDGTIDLEAQANYLYGEYNAVLLGGSGSISVTATAGDLAEEEVSGDLSNRALGSGTGIHAGSGSTGTITLTAEKDNYVAGSEAGIYLESGSNATIELSASGNNVIGKELTAQTSAGEEPSEKISTAQIAVNAQGGSVSILSTSGVNTITGLECGISASSGAEVNISGATQIMAVDSSGSGTTALSASGADDESGSTITLSYSSESYIFGDIEAENSASITAAALDDSEGATLRVLGNISSVAQATVSLSFGDGGYLEGAADNNFVTLNFSADEGGKGADGEDTEAGVIDLKFGEGSVWYMTDASSVDELSTKASSVIYLNNDVNDGASYLMATSASGGGTIYMTLEGDRSQSSMLYFGEASGEYNIVLSKMITAADVVGNGTYDNLLRFATVGSGSNVTFYVAPFKDVGLYDISYEVVRTDYDENDDTNEDYNDGEGKPGDSNVEEYFETYSNTTNYSLTVHNSLSDAGKNIVDMARANYTMAVYLDTLNKAPIGCATPCSRLVMTMPSSPTAASGRLAQL